VIEEVSKDCGKLIFGTKSQLGISATKNYSGLTHFHLITTQLVNNHFSAAFSDLDIISP